MSGISTLPITVVETMPILTNTLSIRPREREEVMDHSDQNHWEDVAMASIIEIKDSDLQGVLAVDLLQLLDLLKEEGSKLTWAILDLEATGDLGNGRRILDMEQEIRSSASGLVMTWDALRSLARAFDQVLNATIVGCQDLASAPRFLPGDSGSLYNSCEIVLEAIDSSLWRIYSKSPEVIRRLQASFRDVEVIT